MQLEMDFQPSVSGRLNHNKNVYDWEDKMYLSPFAFHVSAEDINKIWLLKIKNCISPTDESMTKVKSDYGSLKIVQKSDQRSGDLKSLLISFDETTNAEPKYSTQTLEMDRQDFTLL